MLFSSKNVTPRSTPTSPDRDQIAAMLHASPEALQAFETSYHVASLNTPADPHDVLGVDSRQAVQARRDMEPVDERPMEQREDERAQVDALVQRIVDGLVRQTDIWTCGSDGENVHEATGEPVDDVEDVSLDDVNALPPYLRPRLTATRMHVEIPEPSHKAILMYYQMMLDAKTRGDETTARSAYHHFRQGLDILDLDRVLGRRLLP